MGEDWSEPGSKPSSRCPAWGEPPRTSTFSTAVISLMRLTKLARTRRLSMVMGPAWFMESAMARRKTSSPSLRFEKTSPGQVHIWPEALVTDA